MASERDERVEMDGQQQREVISALERSLRSAIASDVVGLSQGAVAIRRLNQLPVYEAVPDLLEELAVCLREQDRTGAHETATRLYQILRGGPFEPLIAALIASLSS
ncbi:hypothetical protein [Ferrimicrobium sp.]|uniref:hypothetical protein n=1 Tax=Ferrimicrobium sp. TaxID=2926050 RepID=UPI002638A63E|nr:hypothetical protein [Ferrimicrobium sp.]